MCIVGMWDSQDGNQLSINYATNVIARFEHQKSQTTQPMELK